MVWTEEYRINSHGCDCNGFVKPSEVLRYMHETANMQLLNCGPSNEELRADNKAFILSKVNMSIYDTLRAYDKIKVETWACESRGVSFNRCSRMYRGDDLVAEMLVVCALVDIETKQLCRVADVQFGFDAEDTVLELDAPGRIRIPAGLELALRGEHTVTYSQTDMNMHLNNTNYLDLFCDYLPNMKHKRVITVSINYSAEAPLGSTLKVYCAEDDGTYYFRTVRDDGKTNAEAILMAEYI